MKGMIETKFKETEVGLFPADWKEKTIQDLGVISKGKGISRAECGTGNIPCVRYGEIYTDHDNYIKKYRSFISKDVAKTSRKLEYGELLFTGSGETKEDIGKCVAYLGKDEAYAGGDIVIVSPNLKEYEPMFLGFLMNDGYVVNQKALRGQGDAIVHITGKSLATIKVIVPPLPEQRRIATALSDIDSLISSLDQLIEKKRNIKQGTMQQLLTGKTRLKGFSEPWVEKKLGDIGTLAMCKRIFQNETSKNGDVPFYKIGTFGQQADAYISKEKYEEFKSSYRFPQKGDILISAAGTIGRTVVYDGKPAYFQDSNIVWLAHNEKYVINAFLFYFYQKIRWNTEDTTIARLYNNNFNNTCISLPPLPEQRAITSILTSMDDEITALEQKREKYVALKQGMMQELLTGRIRLV